MALGFRVSHIRCRGRQWVLQEGMWGLCVGAAKQEGGGDDASNTCHDDPLRRPCFYLCIYHLHSADTLHVLHRVAGSLLSCLCATPSCSRLLE